MAERPAKPVTRAYLEAAARFYLERYVSSAENLRRILMRRVDRRCRLSGDDPLAHAPVVDDVVRRLAASGVLDDRRYAETKVASLRRRGRSSRMISAKLLSQGVDRDITHAALAADEADDSTAARAHARRRRIGPWRPADRALHRERDLAALARAGFSFEIARATIDGDPED